MINAGRGARICRGCCKTEPAVGPRSNLIFRAVALDRNRCDFQIDRTGPVILSQLSRAISFGSPIHSEPGSVKRVETVADGFNYHALWNRRDLAVQLGCRREIAAAQTFMVSDPALYFPAGLLDLRSWCLRRLPPLRTSRWRRRLSIY